MPYIAKSDRAHLDATIDELADRIVRQSPEEKGDAAYAGLLNYSITRLALAVLRKRFGKIRYWMIATTNGVFKNAGDEFYRRVGVPYEDKKIAEEGDVDLYEEYANDLKASK